jgi:tRNA pseudouridine55 synthase
MQQDYGFLVINKPAGITSFDVIYLLRKITGVKKIGHTGTLDPFATGVLLVAIGKATRFISLFSDDVKTYKAVVQLGIKTITGDITGRIISEDPVPGITSDQLNALCIDIINLKEQTPPNYSAIKINGKRAYELARKEKEFEMPTRSINIFLFDIVSFKSPYLTYSCTVSKGTYIRSLSETVGQMLGTIGTTIELTRTKVGEVDISTSVTLEILDNNNWRQYLLPIDVILKSMTKLELSKAEEKSFTSGIVLRDRGESNGTYLVYADNKLLGLGETIAGNLYPKKVIE